MLRALGWMLPVACLCLLVLPAPRLGAEPPQVASSPEPLLAIHDEAEALAAWALDAGAAPVIDRVDALIAEVLELGTPVAPGSAASAVLDELVAVRYTALTTRVPLPSGYRGEFLAAVAPGAIAADIVDGVPASITLAQAIIESGWGKTAPGHNLFGMKGEGPAGSTVHVGVEYRRGKRVHRKSSFRSYHSFAESIEDHARLLSTRERYAAARAVAEDPGAYARALQGTYATDPRYAAKLRDLSERYELERFDWRLPSAPAVAAADIR